MRKIIYILIVLLGIFESACQDDLGVANKNTADVGSPTTVVLQFGVPNSSDIQITRAGDEEITVSSIRIYVFDVNGDTFLGSDDVTNITSTGNDTYTGTATLYEGTQIVYAIVNAASTSLWTNPISELNNAAEQGKNAFLNTLYDIEPSLVSTNVLPTLTSSNIPLSGKGEVHINSGTLDTNYRTVYLKRPYAAVNFEIETVQTSGGITKTFTPQTYTLHNAPAQSYVMEEEEGISRTTVTGQDNFYTVHTEQINVASGGTATFGFYVPENIQAYQNECSVFEDRDAYEGQGDNKTYTNAPTNGTYIVINGEYRETENGSVTRYADVSYTIHLGDFSDEGSMSDFSIQRNYRYTYKMRVMGVDNIVVEAKTKDEEKQPSAEGDVVDLDEVSELFNLDSHYEQVYVEYNLSDIARNIQAHMNEEETTNNEERLNELIAQNFLLSISTPMNTRTESDPIQPYAGTVETDDMAGVDYHWAEFYSQGTRNAITSYTDTSADAMLSPWQVCKKMGEAVKQICENTSVSVDDLATVTVDNDIIAPFTVFIDEYVYTTDLSGQTVGWDRYTRQNPRTLMIASDMEISSDLNSTYSTVLTYITQTSIETFYSPTSAQTTNALGIETYNEHGVIEGRSYQTWENGERVTKYVIGFGENKEGGTGTNTGNGRANMLTNINWQGDNLLDWSTYIDFTKVGYLSDNTNTGNVISELDDYMVAYKACLSRNRDLNRNHKIDNNEVRWYLPAINQYLRMGIGAQSLSAEARMYTGSKSALSSGSYPSDFLEDGALYYTNTESENFYWAVEVGAYGSTNGHSAQIRCVRNLAKTDLVNGDDTPIDDAALAEAVYGSKPYQLRSGNYMFNFGDRLDVSIFRMSTQVGPYQAHNEDDDENMLPQAFVVSENYIRSSRYPYDDETFAYTRIWGTSTQRDPCINYSENRDDSDEGLWRTPNLNELMVMSTAASTIGLESKNTFSRTQFSNQSVRYGFYYNYNGFITTNNNEIVNNGGYVRCVRDATASEIAESE